MEALEPVYTIQKYFIALPRKRVVKIITIEMF